MQVAALSLALALAAVLRCGEAGHGTADPVPGSGAPATAILTFRIEGEGPLREVPVEAVAHFGPGRCRADGEPRIVDGGRERPAQGFPLGFWPDGSVRRLRVNAVVGLVPGRWRRFELRVRPKNEDAKTPPEVATMRILDDGDALLVRTGGLRFRVPRDAATLLDGLARENDGVEKDRRLVVDGADSAVDDVAMQVLESGPLFVRIEKRASIRLSSRAVLDGVMRVEAHAGAAELEIEFQLGSRGVHGAIGAVDLLLGPILDLESIRSGPARLAIAPKDQLLRLCADAEGRLGFARGDEEAQSVEGLAPGLAIRDHLGRIEVRPRDFLVLGPSSLGVERNGALRLGLVGAEYHFARGTAPLRRFRIGLAREGSVPPGPYLRALPFVAGDGDQALRPPRPARDLPGAPALRSRIDEILARELAPGARVANGFEARGEENAGDWRWSREDWGNLEYDTVLGLAIHGAASKDPDLLEWARRSARHGLMRDLDRRPRGLPLTHGAFHRSGGFELGHVWIEGLMHLAALEGDPMLVEGFLEMRDAFIERSPPRPPRRTLLRVVGWGLLFAAAIERFESDEAGRSCLETWVSALRDAPGEDLPLLEPLKDVDEPQFRVSPWVASGILIPAAFAADRCRPDGALRRRVSRMARRLLDESFDAETGRLYDRLVLDASGTRLQRDGESRGEEMLFFAVGLAHAVALGADADLLAAGGRIARLAMDRLQVLEKTHRGIELSQLLWLRTRL